MKQQMLRERVELLEIGEALGFPRLGIGHSNGRKWSIRAGQSEWEKFCGHAHTTRIPAALRIGRVLRDNGVTPYNPRNEASAAVNVTHAVTETSRMPIALPLRVVALDDPIDEMVKPKRSKAAIRQARWREKRRASSQS